MPSSFEVLLARFVRYHFAVFCCLALLWLWVPSVQAQAGGGIDATGTGGIHTIKGRIYFPSGRRSDTRVMVKLESYNSSELAVMSDSNGTFVFRGLIPGSYTVVIAGGDDYESVREPVYIDSDGNASRTAIRVPPVPRLYTVDISLRPKPNSSVKPGILNVALANTPPAARDLYQKALNDSQAGDSKKAIEELQNALSIYPEFPLALNELGVQYLRLRQPDKAADVLSKAVKLAAQDFQPRLNYGFALMNLRRFAEAEAQLRTAIGLNNAAPTAHMYLGIVLAIQRKLEEGEKELKIAIASRSSEVALAHRYLGGIFLEKHQYQLAAAELETYLKQAPNAADAEWLRQKIKELHNKS
jgi:Tfp pilus assembly protein PilF